MQVAVRWPKDGQKSVKGRNLFFVYYWLLNASALCRVNLWLPDLLKKLKFSAVSGYLSDRQLSASPHGEQFQEEKNSNL
jgi:hypothetical protein